MLKRREVVGAREFGVSLVIWTGAVIYSLWCLLDETWARPGLRFATAAEPPDPEWHVLSRVIWTYAPAFLAHSALTWLLERGNRRVPLLRRLYRPQWFHLAFTAAVLAATCGPRLALFVVGASLILTSLSYVAGAVLTWLVALSAIFAIVMTEALDVALDRFGVDLDYNLSFVVVIWSSWTMIKFISMSVDGDAISRNFFVRLGYLSYFPTIFSGPPLLFSVYVDGIARSSFNSRQLDDGRKELSVESPIVLGIRLVRYSLWGLALDYVYSSWNFDYTRVPNTWSTWTVCGLGYWLGQAMMMKYVVFYGVPSTFARFEGIAAPPAPACIGRIHRYSDMWRKFDVGLNQFLVRYVYVPLRRASGSKIVGVVGSFAFVACWHAATKSVLIWVFLNGAGILIEGFLDSRVFPRIASPRVKCVLLANLMVASCISNFFFLGGYEVGAGIFWRILQCSVMAKFWILFFLYNCCVASAYILETES